MTRLPGSLFALILAAVALAACAPTIETPATSETSARAQTATVQRATVIGVLTLKGTVVQGASFQLHTSATGTVTDVDTGSVTVAPSDGSAPITIAPSDGGRFDHPLVGVGDTTVPGMAVASATASGFTIRAALQSADLLRLVSPPLGARAQVDGGPGPFDCPLVDAVPTVEATTGDSSEGPELFCSIPSDMRVLSGMPATVVIQLEKAEDALVLPIEAVAGTVDSGTVYVRGKDEQPVETPVKLGTTDGVHIVILDGLNEGDTVFVPGPWLGQRGG